jgi:hypothetical protein
MVPVEQKMVLVLVSCSVVMIGLSACSSAKDAASPSGASGPAGAGTPAPRSSSPAAADAPPADAPPPRDVVAQIIREALRTDGSVSYDELVRRLGPPLRTRATPTANAYQPDQTDTLRTLVYRGLEALVYDVSASRKTFLIRFSLLTDRYATPEGLRVGDPSRRAIDLLGAPTRRNPAGDEWIYSESDAMPTAMVVTVQDQTITRIEWEFYFS